MRVCFKGTDESPIRPEWSWMDRCDAQVQTHTYMCTPTVTSNMGWFTLHSINALNLRLSRWIVFGWQELRSETYSDLPWYNWNATLYISCISIIIPNMWLWSTKAVISNTGIFVAIANNTLYGSKLYIFILWQKSLWY